VLEASDLDAVLHVGPHKRRAEGDKHFLRPPGHISFDAAQDGADLLGTH